MMVCRGDLQHNVGWKLSGGLCTLPFTNSYYYQEVEGGKVANKYTAGHYELQFYKKHAAV